MKNIIHGWLNNFNYIAKMNIKTLNAIFFMMLWVYNAYTQDFIKIKEQFNKNGMLFFKDEIYPQNAEGKIIMGNDTIGVEDKYIEKISFDITKYFHEKFRFITRIDISTCCINVSPFLNGKDTIKLIKSDNSVIPFVNEPADTVKIETLGNTFRLIIPGFPTLVYNDEEIIKQKIITKPQIQSFNKSESENSFTKLDFKWWHYCLLAFFFMGIFTLGYWLFYSKKKLKNFTREPQKVKYEKPYIDSHDDLRTIEDQLTAMEKRLTIKITEIAKNSEMQKTIEKHKSEINLLKEKSEQNSREKEKLIKEIEKVHTELQQVNNYGHKLENELNKINEKVIIVEFLEPYSRNLYDYFSFIKVGIAKAIEFIDNNLNDKNEIILASQLFSKFLKGIPPELAKWEETISIIIEKKIIVNSLLMSSFNQLANEDEKIKEFKRILFKEILMSYISSTLIFSEELSRFSVFTRNETQNVLDLEQYFSKFKDDLQNKTKAIGLNLNYVPLFENYEKYAAFTKLVKQTCSSPYNNIKNLSKDSVLEIINYGFDNDETKVILA